MKVEGFIGGQDVQKSLNLSDNQCVNLYPTTNNDGSIQAFYKVDGLKEEATLSGMPTGAYKTSTGRQFYVSGTTLYELSASLVSTSRGTLTAGTYSFSDNGIELICVNGIDGWLFTLATNTLTKIKVLKGDITITIASPAVLTKTNHGLVAGDRVILSTTGVLPSGLLTSTPYYVLANGITANDFQVSLTSGGTAISTFNDYYTANIQNNFWVGIAWNGTVFAAVAQTGVGNRVMTSPDGITWTIRTSAADNDWLSIAWNGTVFAAVASSGAGNRVMTSPDGITWTIRTSAADNAWTSIAWNGTLFAAVASSGVGNRVMTSPDGITWTIRTSAVDNNWQWIAWNGTVFAAVAYSGTGNRVMTSPDGITWTIRTSAADNNWAGIAWNGKVFVVVAYSGTGNRVMISSDGITWTIYRSYGTHSYLTLGYGFPNGCSTVSYMNGRFIAIEKNTQNFFVSEVLDGWWWNALNIQTVDSNPDYNIGQAVSHNELIVFCETSGEVFFDSGTVPTPFIRNRSGIFEVGCLAEKSIAKLDNTIFWLGRTAEGKGIVYRLDGYTPTRISTYSVENSINSMSDVSDAKAFSYQKDGHHFYVLNFPTGNKTWVFDANTNLWHERASFINSTFSAWEPVDHLFFNNKHYVTSTDNKLYSIDGDTYQNGSNPIKVVRSFRAPPSDMKRVVHGKLQLEAEFGVTPINQEEAMMMLRWSNDGGHTWSNIIEKGIGKVGEYFRRVIWNRLGMTKGIPRVYEISNTDNIKVVLIAVYLE